MLEKSKKRGERRWRSFHAWMRRLQSDWWEHGARIDPRGVYRSWKDGGGACSIRRDRHGFWASEGFDCACFDLTDSGAYRFKDHPTGSQSRRRAYLAYERKKLRHSDLKKLPVDREVHGSKRRRSGETFRERVTCFCGYMLGWRLVKSGDQNRWRTFLESPGRQRCGDCKRKRLQA